MERKTKVTEVVKLHDATIFYILEQEYWSSKCLQLQVSARFP